jgi:hypothetical protein
MYIRVIHFYPDDGSGVLLRNARINIQNTHCDDPEDYTVHIDRRENLEARWRLGKEIGG